MIILTSIMILCTVSQPALPPEEETGFLEPYLEETFSPSYKLGISLNAAYFSMSDEEKVADEFQAAGVDFNLNSASLGVNFDFIADISSKLKTRAGISFTEFSGVYSETSISWNLAFAAIFTCGLALLFAPENDVIDLSDEAVSIEAGLYYNLVRNESSTLSVGAGPNYSFMTRKLKTPNTITRSSGSGLGFQASMRFDQEGDQRIFGCIPMLLGFEAGYIYRKIELDGDETDGFELDFSGPFLKFGTYIQL